MERIPIKWWQNATIYRAYVTSFLDSDGDGIGDFIGDFTFTLLNIFVNSNFTARKKYRVYHVLCRKVKTKTETLKVYYLIDYKQGYKIV